jgi:prepilin-type N-terminal cleavage/methylation domain-containing protein
LKLKAFTLIELLVVVAIIGILTSIGVVAYNGYTKVAKNSVIKANHGKVLDIIKSDIAQCNLLGGRNAEIDRYERKTSNTFQIKKQECRSAFLSLQIHFLGLGLRDPVITGYSWYKPWTQNGRSIPNDAGAVYQGTPFKDARFYPAYWVGKTYITDDFFGGKRRLKIQTYLMDEKTLLLNYITYPFN